MSVFTIGVALLFTTTSALASLAPYSPEKHNQCRNAPPTFTSVHLGEGLGCGDTAGFVQLARKLGAWMPARTPRPQLALVLEAQGDNAYFSGYALHVSLRFGKAARDHRFNLFPNAVSRAVVAHEYGHAMLATALAAKNAQHRELLAMLREWGYLEIVSGILQKNAAAAEDGWLKTYTRRFGPQEKWNPTQQAEAARAYEKIQAHFKPAQAEYDRRIERINLMGPGAMLQAGKLMHYHEFFADLVAVLDSGDWAITRKVFQALGLPPADVTPRDFTDSANWTEDVAKGSDRFEAHESMGPSRYALYQRLKQMRCLNPNPQLLLGIVTETIETRVRTAVGGGPGESSYERRGFNSQFIRALFTKIDRSRAELCGR